MAFSICSIISKNYLPLNTTTNTIKYKFTNTFNYIYIINYKIKIYYKNLLLKFTWSITKYYKMIS